MLAIYGHLSFYRILPFVVVVVAVVILNHAIRSGDLFEQIYSEMPGNLSANRH